MALNSFSDNNNSLQFNCLSTSLAPSKNSKNKNYNSPSSIAFLSLFMMLFLGNSVMGQTTLWSTGFESGDTFPTGNANNAASFTFQTSGGNFAPSSVQITAEAAPTKAYDGSVITSSLPFVTGKYYVVTVYAKISGGSGLLQIMKSLILYFFNRPN